MAVPWTVVIYLVKLPNSTYIIGQLSNKIEMPDRTLQEF